MTESLINADTRRALSSSRPRGSVDSRGVITSADDDNTIRWRDSERLEQLFEARCDELSSHGRSAVAVDGPTGQLRYDELDARANQLARYLGLRRGIRPNDRVALLLDRAVDGYVTMLAVLKLGAAYVPLDRAFPPDRIAYIVADAGVSAVLSVSQLKGSLQELRDPVEVLYLDEAEVEVAGERDERLAPGELRAPVDDLCYVIYTSGTTGRPKGVPIRHASICNFVRVAAELYGIQPDDRVYQGLTMAFDFSIEEIWVAWMVGATLVPKPTSVTLLGPDLHDFLLASRVTALCCVPTLLATLEEDLPDLRFLLVSGESCPQDLVERWHRPGRRFLNVYGPTETTVTATWTVLHPSRPVTIGVPLPTYTCLVLDPDADRVLPPGQIGELGIAGIALSDGYLGRPELTEAAFVPDFLELADNPSGRIYRTGDLVRIGAESELEHHGRIDTQVKIRGYRVEAAEIEAVLRAAPGVGQAVVDAYEPELGIKELVAYYTHPADVADELVSIRDWLRARLPDYMVPAYLEPVAELPLLPSGKIDRKALPGPSGPRRCGTEHEHIPPSSELESLLAEHLAAVLGLERVSVESDFFDQLGANSLLMARFTARLRRSAGALPPVSMKDIYLHRTVRSLASALEEQRSFGATTWRDPKFPAPRGASHYLVCGILQLLSFLAAGFAAAQAFDTATSWLFGAHGIVDFYLRAALGGAGLLAGTALLPIAAKWILIGRFKARSIRVWSFAYFRFWVVKTLLASNPVAHMLVGSPLYRVYLRALGAKVGARALIFSHHLPVCTDVLTIGADAVIHKDAYLNGYRARAGMIEIGPIAVGANVFVGERAVLDVDTTLHHDAQLGHSSSLQAGQMVPAGECWHGSPAQRASAEYDYRTVTPQRPSRRRQIIYSLRQLVALVLIAAPLGALLTGLLLTHPGWMEKIPVAMVPAIAAVLLLGGLLASAVLAIGLPRLLSRFLVPGREYPIYGLHYGLQRIIARASNNPLLTGLLGDSVAIVHYLRLLGYRFGVLEQTGSNFGLDVRQELPSLSHIGTGTMVSDGLSIMNAEFSSTSFRVLPVKVGKRNYLGNAISYPASARTADNCLLATKAMVPIAGPERRDVGLLGSPPFEIPRSVLRDAQFAAISTGPERRRRLAAKTRHNVATMLLHLLVDYLLVLGLMGVAVGPFGGVGMTHLAGTGASLIIELAFMLALFVAAERVVTAVHPLAPKYCSIYQRDFWRHERYWKVVPTSYARLLDGTPFKSLLWRALGVPVGRRMLDDGLAITERALVRVGDDSTFNMGSTLQSHTLEDGAFKSDLIIVGNGCTLGTGAFVNYGTVMEDASILEADSFLMKGSYVQPGARWRGNPAAEVEPPADEAGFKEHARACVTTTNTRCEGNGSL